MAPSSTSPPARSRALDGVRGLAALSVLCFHVWLYRTDRPFGPRPRLLDAALFEANLGLVCFFVLSGFLLFAPYARAALGTAPPVRTGAYALRRAARILPAYYVCMAGALALYALSGYAAITPSVEELPVFAVFAQNYSLSTIMQIDPVTWTLAVEAAFYVSLPLLGLLVLALGPRRPGAMAVVLVGLIALSLAWNVHALRAGWSDVGRKALPAYLGYFAAGMLAALVLEVRRRAGRGPLGAGWTAALALAGGALVLATASWHESRWLAGTEVRLAVAALPAAIGFALLIAAIAGGRGLTVRVAAWRPLATLGLVSYGVYLWHLPLLLSIRQVGLLPHALAPRLLVVFAATLAVAALSWRFVERPTIAWAAARRPRRVAARPVPATDG